MIEVQGLRRPGNPHIFTSTKQTTTFSCQNRKDGLPVLLTSLCVSRSRNRYTLSESRPYGTPLTLHTVLYATRHLWKPHAPPIPYITAPGPIPEFLYNLSDNLTNWIDSYRYSRVPTNFQEDAEAGLHSSNFDLAGNIEGEDGRQGLDDEAKREVYIIMKRRGVGFDEARRVWVERKFGREGIGADGRPLDRKAVFFS